MGGAKAFRRLGELSPKSHLVGTNRLELLTPSVSRKCSSHLSYAPTWARGYIATPHAPVNTFLSHCRNLLQNNLSNSPDPPMFQPIFFDQNCGHQPNTTALPAPACVLTCTLTYEDTHRGAAESRWLQTGALLPAKRQNIPARGHNTGLCGLFCGPFRPALAQGQSARWKAENALQVCADG